MGKNHLRLTAKLHLSEKLYFCQGRQLLRNKFVQSNELRKCLANHGVFRQITKGSCWERSLAENITQNDRKKKISTPPFHV